MGAGIQRGGEREEEKEWDGKKERETAAGRGWRGGKGEDGGGVGGWGVGGKNEGPDDL